MMTVVFLEQNDCEELKYLKKLLRKWNTVDSPLTDTGHMPNNGQ